MSDTLCGNTGLRFTPEDLARQKTAIRESIRFMAAYGKGRQPRMNGEYFAPTPKVVGKEEPWVTLGVASIFLGCGECEVMRMAAEGKVRRRSALRPGGYGDEYSLHDLEAILVLRQ